MDTEMEINNNRLCGVDFTLDDVIDIVFNFEGDVKKVRITIEGLIEKYSENLYELLENQENPCTCNISESTPFCECGCYFEHYEIVGFNLVKK